MANPNIVGVQFIRGRTANRKYVKKESRYLLRNAANSNEVLKVNTIRATNKSRSSRNVTVQLVSSTGTTNIVKDIVIPGKTTFSVLEKNYSIYLEENTSLNVFTTTANDSLSIMCSYEQIASTTVSDRSDIYDADTPEPLPPSIYEFETHTFTSASLSGPTGPNLAQLQSAYSATSWASNTTVLNVTTTGIQNWLVPTDGVYEIELVGGSGSSLYTIGGKGGRIVGTVELTAGEILYIVVGQTSTDANGGWNGGGVGGRGGGGATDIRRGGTALADRILVAGGGGGGSTYTGNDRGVGGDGGYPDGTGYFPVTTASGYAIFTGGGGTQTAGGAIYNNGGVGALGQGGAGSSGVGGGGGGGYYGGGGGTYFTPGVNTAVTGGGGSSYYNSAVVTLVSHTTGFNPVATNGYAKITYIGPA